MSQSIAALLYADARADFFGSPGALMEDLAGRPALAWTLERLARVKGLDRILLACPAEQKPAISAVAGPSVTLIPYERPIDANVRAMRAARSFGRYGWRGGIASTTIFDECFDPVLISAVLDQTGLNGLALLPAGSALLDAGWMEEMLAYYRSAGQRYHHAFNQAPPGLGCAVFSADLLRELIAKRMYPGRMLGYDPKAPQPDAIGQAYCRPMPREVVSCDRRFLADSKRGLWLCRQVLARAGADVDGAAACRIAADLPPEPWPREVTIELTTRRPIEDDLRPAARRGDMPVDQLSAVLEGLGECGDVSVVLAGAGDALLHADWAKAVELARPAGAVAIATYGLDLPRQAESVLDAAPEVVQVYVDALGEEVYRAAKRGGSAEQAWQGIEALLTCRDQAGQAVPMIVPTMLKSPQALEEQDGFFERCLERTGWGVVAEPTDAAGLSPSRCVVSMAPPVRTPCRRLKHRLAVLADGRIVACEEDLAGGHPLPEATVLSAWRGETLADLRRQHSLGQWNDLPLCRACREFHRP